jgi:hypothetical protein
VRASSSPASRSASRSRPRGARWSRCSRSTSSPATRTPKQRPQPRHPNRRDHLRGPGRGRRQPRRAARAAGATLTKEPTDAEFFEGRDAYPPTRKAAAGRSPGPRTATPLWRPPAEPPANPPEPQHVPGTCAHFVQRRIAQPPRPFTVYSAIARSRRGQVRTAAITAGSRSTGSTDPGVARIRRHASQDPLTRWSRRWTRHGRRPGRRRPGLWRCRPGRLRATVSVAVRSSGSRLVRSARGLGGRNVDGACPFN